ncbi:hypothetical protein BGW42_003750 [Actinomortierella wolfii]|nr:hypothetical protein BGW42_003750 [Actinomortierella wolfii]
MSSLIRLFCLLDGNPSSNAFPVHIDRDKTIGELKDEIKSKLTPDLDNTPAHKLTLFQVSIHDEDGDSPITIKHKTKLVPMSKISSVFDDNPPEDTIHILIQLPSSAGKLDRLTTFTITINDTVPKIIDWTISPPMATIDGLREHIYNKYPLLQERSKTIVWEDNNKARYIKNDEILQSFVRTWIRDDTSRITLHLEDPAKPFTRITSDDPLRIYGAYIDTQPFDGSKSLPFTSDDHTKALDNLFVTLGATLTSMPPTKSDLDQSAPAITRHYSSAFLMHAVTLFPDLSMEPEKQLKGPRGFGPLDYAIVSKTDPSSILAVTTFPPQEFRNGVAQNVVQLDTIASSRKRKRDEDDEDDRTSVVSFGIATDSRDWYLQEVIIDEPRSIGFNFPSIRSSKIPKTINFADEDKWKSDAEEIFRHLVSHIQKMVNNTQRKKSKTTSKK